MTVDEYIKDLKYYLNELQDDSDLISEEQKKLRKITYLKRKGNTKYTDEYWDSVYNFHKQVIERLKELERRDNSMNIEEATIKELAGSTKKVEAKVKAKANTKVGDLFIYLDKLFLDTDYREALARILMDMGIDNQNHSLVLTDAQLEEAVTRLDKQFQGDYQYDDFKPFVRLFLHREEDVSQYESLADDLIAFVNKHLEKHIKSILILPGEDMEDYLEGELFAVVTFEDGSVKDLDITDETKIDIVREILFELA